jgi:flagellar protein FlaG
MANNDVLVQSSLQSSQPPAIRQTNTIAKPVLAGSVTEASAAKELVESQDPELQREQQQLRVDDLRDKVAQLNDYMQNLNRSLQFSVDEDSGDTVVKVIDSETEEVVRQIPSEAILKIRNAVAEYRGILLEIQA